jgi:hypothetical protein
MKIALIIPQPNFLEDLALAFRALGHTVIVNGISADCDVMISMSISVINLTIDLHQKQPDVPMVVYNWDWYAHIDKTTGDWLRFTQLMREAKEVWSASKITADACEKDTGIKSPAWFYAFITPQEWSGTTEDEGYILQASRQDGYKRFDWFMKAALALDIPYKAFHPNTNPRPEYIHALKHCSFVVVSSLEESLGTLSALEGAYNHKPVLIGDFPGAVEVWKGRQVFYHLHDFEHYKTMMKMLWDERRTTKVIQQCAYNQYYVQQNFTPAAVANKMANRLTEILCVSS